jgi:dihydroorotate dehydrogenase (fumarate)
MNDPLQTEWLGLTLKNPIVAASCGMTNRLESLRSLEDAGVGAVVLKSLYEEEIGSAMEAQALELVHAATSALDIPVVASINCITPGTWTKYAKRVEQAGAAGLELNIFIQPTDFDVASGDAVEGLYHRLIHDVLSETTLPVTVKISHYFTLLGHVMKSIGASGVAGMTLFNRFFYPDFDLETLTVDPAGAFSSPEDFRLSLKWIAVMAGRVPCDLAASTGIHSGDTVIKHILAGATVVQIASALYRHGAPVISTMEKRLRNWLDKMEFSELDDIRGSMSQLRVDDPAIYDRVQFRRGTDAVG